MSARRLVFTPLTEADAQEALAWHYPGAHAAYDLEGTALEDLLDPAHGYHAMRLEDGGALVGYFCLGPHARVAGGTYRDDALDLGLALAPAWAGRGKGLAFTLRVLAQVARRHGDVPVRVTIAEWNRRALGVARALRFREVAAFGGFRRAGGGRYLVLVRRP